MVPWWAVVWFDSYLGRCHFRDLLRAIGRGWINPLGDDRDSPSHSRKRYLLRFIFRPGKPFLFDTEGGRAGWPASLDASRASIKRARHSIDSGVLAASARQKRTLIRDLARQAAAGVENQTDYNFGAGKSLSAARIYCRVQWSFQPRGGRRRHGIRAVSENWPGAHFFDSVRKNSESGQHGQIQESVFADWPPSVARNALRLPRRGLSALWRHNQHRLRSAYSRQLFFRWFASETTDYQTEKDDTFAIFLTNPNRTSNLLTKADICIC